jgi:hypothetical protein
MGDKKERGFDSFYDALDELEADLNGSGGATSTDYGKQTIGESLDIINHRLRTELMGEDLGGESESVDTTKSDRIPDSGSLYDEFFLPEPVVDFERENNDPTLITDINRRKAKKKLLEYFSKSFLLFTTTDNSENLLGLEEKEYRELILLLGLPKSYSYSDQQLIEAGKRLIMAELKIFDSVNYSFYQLFEFAKKTDSVFSPYREEIFDNINLDNFFHTFDVSNSNSFDSESVFSFCMMKPEQRSAWVVSKFSLKNEVKLQLMVLLGVSDEKKYSIQDIKSIADYYDTNGRGGSGLFRIMGHYGYEAVPLFEKKYSVSEVLRFVLLPEKFRIEWIELQKK